MARWTKVLTPQEWLRLSGFAAGVLVLHALGWGLFLYYSRDNPALAGLGTLAYTFGLRHAFDVDHIAAIDNTTRKSSRKASARSASVSSSASATRRSSSRSPRPRSRIRSSWQMYPLGVLFGLGFDTATEVGLLALAAGVATHQVPLLAVISLPLLFAAGMSLMDTADGAFMSQAYGWAFSNPIRKVYYNITVTTLSVTVALLIGTVELLQVAATKFGLDGGFWAFSTASTSAASATPSSPSSSSPGPSRSSSGRHDASKNAGAPSSTPFTLGSRRLRRSRRCSGAADVRPSSPPLTTPCRSIARCAYRRVSSAGARRCSCLARPCVRGSG